MKKKRILYIICILLVFATPLVLGMYYNFNRNIDKSKVENDNLTKGLSMMLETGRGTGQYEMAIRDKWPTEGYIFNETLSKCENGGTLEWDDVNKTVKVHTSVSDKCYVYFDAEPSDIYIATSNLPTTYGATGSVTCSSNGATYNQKYNRVEISSINTEYENCSLTYTEQTSKTYLNDYIIGLAGTTQGTGEVVIETATIDNSTFTAGNILIESGYSVLTNEMSNSDTDSIFTFDSSTNTWTSNNHTDSATATMTFNVTNAGHYQVCYTQSSESYYDYTIFYKNNTLILSLNGVSTTSYKCTYLGEFSASDTIKVTYKKDGSGSRGSDNVVFYLQGGTYNEDFQTVSAGTRYEGKNPNNYIWFNNELWRIIGVFDENSHGQSGTNLVKIIRVDLVGGFVWSQSNTNTWVSSSLNKLLNGAYLNAQDGTDSEYCYISVQTNCDYKVNGIQNGYRSMIQNVTWYLGGSSSYSATADAFYGYERSTTVYSGRPTSTTGYIGLMYPSDFGYSVLSSSCARTTNLDSYDSSSCGGQSWIAGNGYEWMLSPDSSSSDYVFYLRPRGYIYKFSAMNSMAVRPVLYLSADVYYVDGDGSMENPIIIGE